MCGNTVKFTDRTDVNRCVGVLKPISQIILDREFSMKVRFMVEIAFEDL